MRVLLLSRYGDLGASSRVRYLQYLGDFQERGWTVEISPLFSNAYLEALYGGTGRFRETVVGYVGRLYALLRARKFDVLIIEKELFPFLPAWFERVLSGLGVPYVVDYDDALFHRYDLNRRAVVRAVLGRKIDAVMRHAALVIAGNEYLADRARAAGARSIEIIPTVVDTERYRPVAERVEGPLVVGWIGTPKTSYYLETLLPMLPSCTKSWAYVSWQWVRAQPISPTPRWKFGLGRKRRRCRQSSNSILGSCRSKTRHGSAASAATS